MTEIGDSTAGAGQNRDATVDRVVPRWLVPAGVAGIALLLLLSPFWAPLIFSRMDFFRVRHVELVGARYVQAPDVIARMQVDTSASIWDPPGAMERRVAEHPLVKSVEIDRRMPGTLVVRVTEHAPVALVQGPRGFSAYDARGIALPIDPSRVDVDAPVIARPDTIVLSLLAAARARVPALFSRISEVRREGPELVMVLDSVPVRTMTDVTLERLGDVEIVEMDLARRSLRPAELDLRFRDQVIARLQ